MNKGAAAVLVLTLLAQSAAAVGRAPCAPGTMDHAAAAHAAQLDAADHATAHAGHHRAAVAAPDDMPGRSGDQGCCNTMTPIDCATGGCTAGAGLILMQLPPGVAAVIWNHGAYREPDWLPPYLAPSSGIFRPPIA